MENKLMSANSHSKSAQGAFWSGIFAMTLCVFVLIASEFMPVSLLSPIAKILAVSEGMAGQGIAISGAFAVITSLSISSLLGNADRKIVLLVMTGLMVLSAAIIAMAPNYVTYLIGRALIGIAIGGFWSLSAAVAIRLVPEVQVPKALAIFNGGNSLATVIAPPLGSFIGDMVGWRGAFFCIVPVALIAIIWQWISLPSLKNESNEHKGESVISLLKKPLVLFGLLAAGLFFMGQYSLFTYIRPYLETVTRIHGGYVSIILFVIGLSGFLGTLIVSKFLSKGIYRVLITIPLVMTAAVASFILFGHLFWAVAVTAGVWGLFSTAAPTGWWSWLADSLPNDAEAGGGLMVAIIQLSIALGSTVGGVVFDHFSWQATFILSGGLLIIAGLMTSLTAKYSR